MSSSYNTSAFLYEKIVADITHRIDAGSLRPGDRLPSVRSFSQNHGISISTVLQAYRSLEDRMLVEARPQSGFFVRPQIIKRPSEPTMSAPPGDAHNVAVTALINEVRSTNQQDLVPLGAAIPSPDLLPIPQLNKMMGTAIRQESTRSARYLYPLGDLSLRQEIARRSLSWGFSVSSEEIIVTCGCMEALALCLRAVAREGQTIAVESPTYYGILQLIESYRMKALEIPTHPRDGICLDTLERAFQRNEVTACIFMPNFNNPLGCVMSDEKKKKLNDLAGAYNIPIIEDDLYGEIFHEPPRPKALRSFDTHNNILYCSSFSKTLAPGYRVGWAVPGPYMERVMQVKMATTIATSSPPQMAISEFLSKGGYEHHLRRLRRAYAFNIAQLTNAIGEHFPTGTRVTRPKGGFVLWVELPPSINAIDMYRKALAQGIGIAPGPLFTATQSYSNFIRLNGGYHWSPEIEEAIKTLGTIAADLL